MLRIGVTGLMASGKSTVARRFAEHGAAVIEGDALGWEVLRVPAIRDAVAAAFGAAVRSADGEIDRPALGRIVFGGPAAMARLDAIVQPALLADVRRALDGATAGVVVLDAALLTRWELEPELDGVVEVTAPVEARVRRLMESKGFQEAEARARVEGQRLPPVRGARRHWRIENDAGPGGLARRADAVWSEIRALAEV
jgi:dephospho-CoA kinase